jgi:hypothetical protein
MRIALCGPFLNPIGEIELINELDDLNCMYKPIKKSWLIKFSKWVIYISTIILIKKTD